MEKNGDLNFETREKIFQSLSKLLADSYALYLKTQVFHWNVVGKEFFSLHLHFEKQYQDLADAIDEIAERIRALGFYVEGSFTIFKLLSSIEEEPVELSAHEMLEKLASGHEVVIRHLRHSLSLLEKAGDGGSVDLVGRRLIIHEKALWMLRSQA
jgi:starvation-inducible DNA-binding protein